MVFAPYLAMTAGEMSGSEFFSFPVAWMACHFSPYGTGITNRPRALPPGSMLILNDRMPVCGHDPERVARQLEETAQRTGLAEDAQAARDLSEKCLRFEKKIHDLELTRAISIQTAPQIRMIQNNDTVMVEKIQTTLVNTIPLWKNQMVLALGIAHSTEAAQAQRVVVLHQGHVAADGTPKEVFSQVELLHKLGLAAPETVELCFELNKLGYALPLDQLNVDECAQTLYNAVKV